jgi:hypothetical protein
MKRSTITVSLELKKKLDALRGSKTWEEFLTELLNTALEAKLRELKAFLRSTADKRDIPFEKLELRLKGSGDAGPR